MADSKGQTWTDMVPVTSCLYCGANDFNTVTERSDGVGILRCGNCQVMMVDRTYRNTAGLYGNDYFEKAGEAVCSGYGYDGYFSAPAANLMGKYAFARLFTGNISQHVDLGCADGSLMELFAAQGIRTAGLEISPDAVERARAKGLSVEVSDLKTWPKKLSNPDVITAYDILEHLEQPGGALQIIHDRLADNGSFVFTTLSVNRLDSDEYWFNNSLEHYVYFDRHGLERVLKDVFGERNFFFVEVTTNGVAEFWGVAKKGHLGNAAQVLQDLDNGSFEPKDPHAAWLATLVYCQMGRFTAAKQLISLAKQGWQPAMLAEATFYFYYYQGKFEKAIKEIKNRSQYISAANGVLWQAFAHAEHMYQKVRLQQADEARESEILRIAAEADSEKDVLTQEILGLRTDLFKVRDELHALKNSRVLGRIIKTRKVVGDSARQVVPTSKRAARAGVFRTRKAVAKVLPPPVSRAIMRGLRGIKRRVEYRRTKPVQYKLVKTASWPADRPLVSVVIPYYNRADTVDDTIQSLAKQTFRNFETIIVDDGSPEQESVDKLRQLDIRPVNGTIIYQKNQGVAAARNTGIAAAKGKYIICLDSDDMLDDTFIEKACLVLETTPDVSMVTTYQDMFGVIEEVYAKSPYDPVHLYDDNMVITAAAFTKEAWIKAGGYKPGIGYEDWEFWLNLAGHGYWGKLLPEPLFHYRTSLQSRYVDDKDLHWGNIRTIRSMHPKYKAQVKSLQRQRASIRHLAEVQDAFTNLIDSKDYQNPDSGKPNVLITMPWMTFGGAETLIYNFCRQIKSDFNISFITGLKSDNEWEYKFREISPRIYHLANLFEREELYLEFVSAYIATRKVDVLHIIHNGFMFDMLPELRRRHPNLKIAVTVFNDRAPYFEQSIEWQDYIDAFTSDNQSIGTKYSQRLKAGKMVDVYPNGIDCFKEFNPDLFNRQEVRRELGLQDDDVAVFFVGRLSEEKNPDVFVKVAQSIRAKKSQSSVKFFVIGDGPMNAEIMKMIGEGKQQTVAYLGYRASDEVAKYMAGADIFVLPSKIEGFPLSILEAMAMQLVVIASRVGAIPDVIENGVLGYVVSPGSQTEISEVILALDKDRRQLKSIKRNARKEVEAKYSLQVFGSSYNKLYRTLSA